MTSDYWFGLLGGAMIGLAAAGMLYSIGRIMGVSGIVGGLINIKKDSPFWRLFFLAGIFSGAFMGQSLGFPIMEAETGRETMHFLIAGLIVGVGTSLGSGCTSGHGVCGLSRLSRRSIVATIIYVAAGFLSVYVMNHLLGMS